MRLLIGILVAVVSSASWAGVMWVESSTSTALPGEKLDGKTYFSPEFTHQKGTYKATYESVTDSRDSISGTFLVGTFRYTYNHPNAKSFISPKHDEIITKVLLDCAQHFSGNVSTVYLLKGKTVKTDVKPEEDISLYQDSTQSTVEDLCAFAKTKKAW